MMQGWSRIMKIFHDYLSVGMEKRFSIIVVIDLNLFGNDGEF